MMRSLFTFRLTYSTAEFCNSIKRVPASSKCFLFTSTLIIPLISRGSTMLSRAGIRLQLPSMKSCSYVSAQMVLVEEITPMRRKTGKGSALPDVDNWRYMMSGAAALLPISGATIIRLQPPYETGTVGWSKGRLDARQGGRWGHWTKALFKTDISSKSSIYQNRSTNLSFCRRCNSVRPHNLKQNIRYSIPKETTTESIIALIISFFSYTNVG